MRPINKSFFKGNKASYNPYGSAKDDLITAIGSYCTFCERNAYSSALDVEHIKDKHTHPLRSLLWRNFVLGCKNCNPIKGNQQILNMYFPTVHDTFHIISYSPLTGAAYVNTAVCTTPQTVSMAQGLIELVGLDRTPGHPRYSMKDKRWSERQDTFLFAQKYFSKYLDGDIELDTLIDFAKLKGYWSIWMEVCKTDAVVIGELIDKFPCSNKKFLP
ncbi:hypothetical protein JGK46_003629 [Aeromonas bestiarum]|jgi:hypothetical protein|nr:hypothetical protein [Aeromonas bestiarum]